jgi:hypothetical protein
MRRPKGKPSATLIDRILGEASWLLSHAQALTDYRRPQEAAVEWARAAECEEQVACLLDADGQEREAAIHRVSAASGCEKVGQYTRAVTLLRAALSAPLYDDHRGRVKQLLTHCLAQAKSELTRAAKRTSRKQPSAVP